VTSQGDESGEPGALGAGADWYWRMLELRPHYPGAPVLPIRADWREGRPPKGPAASVFRQRLAHCQDIIDVGAGDRYWGDVLARLGIDARYTSADIDTRHPHEYSDFLEVEDRFDCVLMLELLEHLELQTGLDFLAHATKLLKPGGVLVISTPNAHHAHQVWSADFTHVRPWPSHDLWALCTLLGYSEIAVYRQWLTGPRRRLVKPLQFALSNVLGIDPAYGLLVFATKPRAAAQTGDGESAA
jgi:predicted SAM-dependent methyltransferase